MPPGYWYVCSVKTLRLLAETNGICALSRLFVETGPSAVEGIINRYSHNINVRGGSTTSPYSGSILYFFLSRSSTIFLGKEQVIFGRSERPRTFVLGLVSS